MPLSKRSLFALFILLAFVCASAAVAQSEQVYVTTQRFEHGLMIWRADNSTIYVLADDGQARTYGVFDYSSLPDNPIKPATPDALRPIFGFGQIWGNHADVRALLGNPVLPEIGFETSILVVNATIEITELDSSVLQIRNDGTWIRLSVEVTPPPCATKLFFDDRPRALCPAEPITTKAAYQPFEHGFMIWLSSGGDVWVFADPPHPLAQAHWQHFAQTQYANFAPAPPEQAPTNRHQPVGAFGRVWQNLHAGDQSVRQELGWATAPEQSYQATVQLSGTYWSRPYLSIPA